jgi:hypothetical protein
MSSEDTQKIFADERPEAEMMDPEEFSKFIIAETDKCGKVVGAGNIKVEQQR